MWPSRWTVALVAAMLVLIALPAGADDGCGGAVTGLFVVDDRATLYLDDRGDDGRWLYAESSGSTGLQRGGSIAGIVEDPCGDPATADTLLAMVSAPV